MSRYLMCWVAAIGVFAVGAAPGWSQVVTFRLETTDSIGTPVDSIAVGEEFLLKTYTQHVHGFDSPTNSGVFAGYLDISYDSTMASIAGVVDHGPMYGNVVSGDFSVPGLMDNIGGVSSSGEDGWGFVPIGLDEQLVFSVPLRADAAGQLTFVGSESLSYPSHDVLVYGLNEPVPARDIDFGAADLRIDFGTATLNVRPVPEPRGLAMLLVGLGVLLRRKIGD